MLSDVDLLVCVCVNLSSALQLLSKFANGPDSPMAGVWPTIDYLNKLPIKYFDLVLEYSILPLKVDTAHACVHVGMHVHM